MSTPTPSPATMPKLAPGIDAADLVEQTYYALRHADYAEREAQGQLLEAARQYASCKQNYDLAEEMLINLGDAAIELDRRRQTFETCQQEMKLLWRIVNVRSRR